jgi:hypothetical protein
MPGEFIIGAVVGVAAASKKIRSAVRSGLIYGLGGLLVAYDKVVAGARGAVQGARGTAAASQGSTAPANGTPAATQQASPSRPAEASPAATSS